jgi:hypothetical protein
VRALNVIGTIALVALAFYLGWVLIGEADDRRTTDGSAVAAPPIR